MLLLGHCILWTLLVTRPTLPPFTPGAPAGQGLQIPPGSHGGLVSPKGPASRPLFLSFSRTPTCAGLGPRPSPISCLGSQWASEHQHEQNVGSLSPQWNALLPTSPATHGEVSLWPDQRLLLTHGRTRPLRPHQSLGLALTAPDDT